MQCIRNLTNDVVWVGASDRRLHRFENLFPVPYGVSYNAYVIKSGQTALIDTTDASVSRQFFENLSAVLEGGKLDYFVINHMEPDHSATIAEVLLRYPDVKIVGTAKTFQMIGQFFDVSLAEAQKTVVKEGDTLNIGEHTLRFITAPMVHWPEVMMTYDETEKLLFSADAFGTFGALDGAIFQDETAFDLSEARRYYTNIVGKYGAQVQAVLKKAASLAISFICPLHGPVLRGDFAGLLEKYDLWSKYLPEDNELVIFYASMYGGTENAVQYLATNLSAAGVKNIRMYDVSKTDVSYLVAEAFRASHLVFAAPTYNAGLYPPMEALLSDLKAHSLKNKAVALIENGSWALSAAKHMQAILESMTGMTPVCAPVSVQSTVSEQTRQELDALANALRETL